MKPKNWIESFSHGAFPVLLSRGMERLKGSKVTKIANPQKVSMDDIYYVSAVDVADKIIDHMRRGLDPLLFSSPSFALFPISSMSSARSRKKYD